MSDSHAPCSRRQIPRPEDLASRAAFALWAHRRARLWAPSAGRCCGYGEPDDFTQTVCMRLLDPRRRVTLPSREGAVGWLRRAALRAATDAWRKASRVEVTDQTESGKEALGIFGQSECRLTERLAMRDAFRTFFRVAPAGEAAAFWDRVRPRSDRGPRSPAERKAWSRSAHRLRGALSDQGVPLEPKDENASERHESAPPHVRPEVPPRRAA